MNSRAFVMGIEEVMTRQHLFFPHSESRIVWIILTKMDVQSRDSWQAYSLQDDFVASISDPAHHESVKVSFNRAAELVTVTVGAEREFAFYCRDYMAPFYEHFFSEEVSVTAYGDRYVIFAHPHTPLNEFQSYGGGMCAISTLRSPALDTLTE